MKSKLILTSLMLFGASGHAFSQESADVADLVKASGCLTCHAVNEKIVGPAFKDVAAKYANDADAVVSLAQSVKNGSRGKWGRVPMPPHASISTEDLTTLTTWVMSHKP